MAGQHEDQAPDMQWVFGSKGPLARRDGYSVRPGQIAMAEACAAAFSGRFILLAEAGTGTGKTYAYLLPALLSGKCTVISVHTRALQDQLFCHDIPQVLELLGHPPRRVSLLKGLENYLCLKKYYAAAGSGGLGAPFDHGVLSDFVHQALHDAGSGREDRAPGDISQSPSAGLLRRFAYGKHHCLQQVCPHYDQCFAFAARARSVASDVVVVNHSLLFSALALRDRFRGEPLMLPPFDNLIFDECHTLSEVGRGFFTRTYAMQQVFSACRSFMQGLRRMAADLEPLFMPHLLALRAHNQQLLHHLAALETPAITLPHLKYMEYRPEDPAPPVVNEAFTRLIHDLSETLGQICWLCDQHVDRAPDELRTLYNELSEQQACLLAAMYNDRDRSLRLQPDRSTVAYAEVHADAFTISVAPITIGRYFGAQMAELSESVQAGMVMTSATFAVGQDFSQFRSDTLGDMVPASTMVVPSSFDYPANTRLYISEDFPPPEAEHRTRRLLEQLVDVIDIVRGGILFLATSHRAVREAGEFLAEKFRGRRLVLWQNMPGDPSSHELLHSFRDNGHAILAGTYSFWQGVDVPGPALTLVIIDRLPFRSPADPVFQALRDKLKEEHGRDLSFSRVMLPEAIIRLRQGVGRLVRTETDRGGVIIADPRLATRRYRHAILRALPPMGRCHGLGELREFLQSI